MIKIALFCYLNYTNKNSIFDLFLINISKSILKMGEKQNSENIEKVVRKSGKTLPLFAIPSKLKNSIEMVLTVIPGYLLLFDKWFLQFFQFISATK